MRTMLPVLALLLTFVTSPGVQAGETIRAFGAVSLVSGQDDFTDETQELLVVQKSGFMAEILGIGYASGRNSLGLLYQHNDLILDDIDSLIYRVNKLAPVTISCMRSEDTMSVVVIDQQAIARLLDALVAEDKAGPVKLVIMVVDQTETKAEFDFEGVAGALAASKYISSHVQSAR